MPTPALPKKGTARVGYLNTERPAKLMHPV